MTKRLLDDSIYIILRIMRRMIPNALFTKMLVNDLVVKSSLGYKEVEKSFALVTKQLEECGVTLKGKRVLELGFGGALQMGMLYQMHGVKKIYLVDKFAKQKFDLCTPFVQALLQKYPQHDFRVSAGKNGLSYDKEIYEVYFEDLEEIKLKNSSIDLIVSLSVYEHLENVEGLIRECKRLLSPEGVILTAIDLSDHFQRYPFHMLKFNERTWKKYLNPPSNLNRLRSLAYEEIFKATGLEILKKTVDNKNNSGAVEMKPFLDEQFQRYPNEVLSELGVTYVLKKGKHR